MAQIRFTDRKIASLRYPEKGQRDYFDLTTKGFGLRVSYGGTKAWFLKYVMDGKQWRHTLGEYPDLSLAKARDVCLNARHQIAHGRNPVLKKKAEKAAPAFEELAVEYVEKHAKLNKRTWRKDKWAIAKYLANWHPRKAESITRGDVIEILDTIAATAPIMANRVLALVRKIFNFGIEMERVTANPAHKVKRRAAERSRDRVYSDDELRRLWAAFDGPAGAIYKLILVTGQREGEVSGMRWDEIDLEGKSWTIPGARMKHKRVHMVPLSDLAVGIIAGLSKVSGEFVFPSPVKPDQPIRELAKAVARVRAASRVTDFRSHDLRRSMGTNITKLGFTRFVMDRVLGHLEPGVGGHYDRNDYLREKRAALDAWARRLETILRQRPEASNVVALATPRTA